MTVLLCIKNRPVLGFEDGATLLNWIVRVPYAKRATSSCRTSVILTSELTGTNSLTP